MNTPAEPVIASPARTSRKWRLLAVVLLLAVLAPMPWLARRGASRLEFFHLRAVEVAPLRYLKSETVLQALALDTMRSVWDDTAPLAAKLMTLPQVGAVDISRKLPGTLLVEISERLPIALAPGVNGLEPVDSAGVILPIDPAQDELDLPVANQRDVPLLVLLGSVRAQQPALYRRISEISRDGPGDIILHLIPRERGQQQQRLAPSITDTVSQPAAPPPPRSLRVRAQLGVSVSRLADIFPVESDLLRRRTGESIAELDLRYRDQVIARLQ
ncbi:MAG: FtsQ-type POTRA domain-containing protein [Gemmatimonadaceae bacterium]